MRWQCAAVSRPLGNSWGLRKLGRDDLGDFSFKKNNACSSVEKTAKSSRLAFLNVDLGLSYCRREHKESAPWVQCLSRDSVAERSKGGGSRRHSVRAWARTPPLSFCVTWAATETAKGPAAQLLFLHTGMRSQCAAVSRPLQAALSSRWARVVGAAQRLSTIVCGGCWEGMGSFCYLCAQVADLQSCDSSVGRTSDWRSEGPLLIVHMVGIAGSPFKPTRADACKRNPSNEQPNAIRSLARAWALWILVPFQQLGGPRDGVHDTDSKPCRPNHNTQPPARCYPTSSPMQLGHSLEPGRYESWCPFSN